MLSEFYKYLLYLFSDFDAVSTRQYLEVGFHGACLHYGVVLGLVEPLAEQNVVPESRVLDPRLLRDVRNRTLQCSWEYTSITDCMYTLECLQVN